MVTWEEDKRFFKELFNGKLNYPKLSNIVIYLLLMLPFIFLSWYSFSVLKFAFSFFNDPTILIIELLTLILVIYAMEGIFIAKLKNPKAEYYSLLFIAIVISLVNLFPIWLRVSLILLLAIVSLPEFYYNWEKSKPKSIVLLTILLMLFIFLVGLMFIQDFYGAEDDTLFLNGCNNLTKGERLSVDCSSLEGSWLIWESEIKCKFISQYNFTNVSGEVWFVYLNGSKGNSQTFSEEISFVPPTFSKITNVKMMEIKNNQTYCYDTVWNNIDFISYEDYKSKKEKFFIYFVTLIGVIFITIPLGIKGLSELNK